MKLRMKVPMSSEPTPTASPPKSAKKRLIVIAATLLLVCGAAGAAYVYMQQQKAAVPEAEVAKRKAPTKSIFTPLENFTVNLRDEGGDHYAQIGVTLEVEDAAVETDLKARLPALRNNILLLIASKSTEDLLTLEGKQLLARQIGVRAAQSIGMAITDADLAPTPADSSASTPAKPKVANPIKDVLFSTFLVQ